MISLETHSLAKRFGTRGVFRDLTFSASLGQTIAISGPNGSGKSTLLKTLLGLVEPSEGTITVSGAGRELTRAQRLEMSAAVTPYFSLYEALSGAENFIFFCRLRGVSCSENDIESALQTFGLAGRGADRVSGYSSGMRQRLKFALALFLKPKLLFVDEPGVNLDDDGREIVFRELKKHHDSALIFWATNESDELAHADRIIELA